MNITPKQCEDIARAVILTYGADRRTPAIIRKMANRGASLDQMAATVGTSAGISGKLDFLEVCCDQIRLNSAKVAHTGGGII